MDNVSTAFSIPSLLYEEGSFGVFILVTILLGGSGAWLTGRAIAGTWRPVWQVAVYGLILAAVVRFIHMALFGGTLLSLHYYLVDAAFCLAFAFGGYKVTRERASLTRWRRKTP